MLIEKFKTLLAEAKAKGDKVAINLYQYVLGQLQNQAGRNLPVDDAFLDTVVREVINGIDQALANLKADDERIVNFLKEKELLLVHKLPDVVKATVEEELTAIAAIYEETKSTNLSNIMAQLRNRLGKDRINGKETLDRVNAFIRSLL